MTLIAAALALGGDAHEVAAWERLAASPLLGGVAATVPPGSKAPFAACARLDAPSLRSAAGVVETLQWFAGTKASHLLWAPSPGIELTASGLLRLAQAAEDSRAAILYSDYYDLQADGAATLHPLIDYQAGSIRDDFDFGRVVLLSRDAVAGLAEAIRADGVSDAFGGWYDLRLRASERGPVVRLSEPNYGVRAVEQRTAGEAHFSYVDPRNRDYQLEMERIATAHLRRIDAWLPPPTSPPVEGGDFPVECSVVIPVRNRVRTVADAVQSALSQLADFTFNVIVVDNHSTDGTTDVLRELAATSERLVHLIPARVDLGIGGCWNEAIHADVCGRYAVQLDSDDIYSSPDVLTRFVTEFRRGGYALVVGSYTICNFELQPIPPGLIDHREWTPENGHNNALRIAGLGAPRAFHVPTLRTIGFPNVSFGEDYAVALRMSRQYPIGRIYDSLYWCRRWEGNTDHALPLETQNRYASYKDRVRTIELAARRQAAKTG
ncbi:MAG: glycosyltransferase family 2 protein [Pirellulales bacterium]|nr:glycosyltransferase family 2 protein [Pirellulales bacterium]